MAPFLHVKSPFIPMFLLTAGLTQIPNYKMSVFRRAISIYKITAYNNAIRRKNRAALLELHLLVFLPASLPVMALELHSLVYLPVSLVA
jgi:hypothetical protein